MWKSIFITLIAVISLTVFATPTNTGVNEETVLRILETSADARAEDIDRVIGHLEDNPARYPWSDAAVGRARVIRGICGDFTMLKIYHQNRGFNRLKETLDANPDDFHTLSWLGASAVESGYLFVSSSSAKEYLSRAVDVLFASNDKHRLYFLSYCYYFLGYLEKDVGDLKRALNYWELAAEIDPGGRMADRASEMFNLFTG
ncbi:MAG: hypothetical protein GY771_06685 [bacterium]|nr:hypothetical protein [bacterium]